MGFVRFPVRVSARCPPVLLMDSLLFVFLLSTSHKCHQQSLCALDALEAAEVPAFLQTGSDAGQLLSERAGQPRKESLHLAGVDLRGHTATAKGQTQIEVHMHSNVGCL